MVDIKDEDLVIELPEGAPEPVVETDQVPAKTPEDEGVAALKAQVEEAKKQREADRLAREEAERRAATAAAEATRAREESQRYSQEASSNRLNAVVTAIDNVAKEIEMATARFEAAAQNGDYKALAVAQNELSKGHAQLLQLENNKAALEEEAKNPRQTESLQTPQTADPVERYIAAAKIPMRSAAWVRSHRDVLGADGNVKQDVVRAHWSALAEGIQPESDAYFAHLDQRLGYAGAPSTSAEQPAQVVNLDSRRAPPPPSAPVSREATSAPASPHRVRLTAEQVEAAQILGMSPQEYAKALLDPETQRQLARGR